MTVKVLTAFALGLATLLGLHYGRGFFWQHAVISGLAVAALVYAGWRTWENLRNTRRR